MPRPDSLSNNDRMKDGFPGTLRRSRPRNERRWLAALVIVTCPPLLAMPTVAAAQSLAQTIVPQNTIPQTVTGPAQAVPQGSPIPRVLPPPPPPVGGALPPVPGGRLDNTAPETPVAVGDVAIEGVTAYPAGTFAPLTAALPGPATRLDQIEAARLGILRRYRDDGYILTSVTASLDRNHHLRFAVIEGSITEVKLDHDIGPAGVQVLRFLSHLTREKPIDTATLERWLLLAQDVPGITLQAVLKPSDTDPGALTLIAQVRRAPYSGLLTADNRAFNKTGPEQALATFDLNSFTSLGERTELSLFRSFNSTNIFGQASTEFFVGGSGLKIRLYGGAGDSTPSGLLRSVGYDGTTTVFGGLISYPVLRQRRQTLNVLGIFDALESDINTSTGNGGSARASFDSLRILRIGADYALQDTLFGGARPAANLVSFRISHGLTALGATRNGSPTAGRVNQKIDFTKGSMEISRNQTLFAPWDGATVSLLGVVAGQVTQDILPSAEEFFLGGARFNRGFYSGEVTGDSAITTSTELQLNTGFNLMAFGTPIDIGAQFYAFFDWGQTFQNQKLDASRHLESTGGGVRASVTQYTEFDVEGVHRITRQPLPGGAGSRPLPGEAIYWRVLTRF